MPITPTLAAGLGLPRAFGLVVCDLQPGGPGEAAGLKIGDVIVEADGRSISTPPQLDGSIYLHDIRQPLALVALRDGSRVALQVGVVEETHRADSVIDTTDPQKNLVPQLGLIAIHVPDLNLHVAEMLYELRLPAALARHVLSAAVQDFIDEARPTDANDWLTLVRAAQNLSRERIEDYIAAAATSNGPLVPESSSSRAAPLP